MDNDLTSIDYEAARLLGHCPLVFTQVCTKLFATESNMVCKDRFRYKVKLLDVRKTGRLTHKKNLTLTASLFTLNKMGQKQNDSLT